MCKEARDLGRKLNASIEESVRDEEKKNKFLKFLQNFSGKD